MSTPITIAAADRKRFSMGTLYLFPKLPALHPAIENGSQAWFLKRARNPLSKNKPLSIK